MCVCVCVCVCVPNSPVNLNACGPTVHIKM